MPLRARKESLLAVVIATLAIACASDDVDDALEIELRHGGHGGHDDGDDDDHDCDDEPDGVIRIQAQAGFSCDFGLDPSIPPETIPPAIERDRMYMADQPGMVHGKHLPLSINPQTGEFFSGGRYLFTTKTKAHRYKEWVTEDYILDGVQFLERPGIIDPDCHEWENIAAYELGDISSDHVVMRTERWSIPGHKNQTHFLESLVPDLVEDAQALGLTGVWLLHNKHERLVEIVYVAGRVGEPPPGQPDFASIFALAGAPSLGSAFTAKNWPKVLDRTHFVLSIWFPFELGDHGDPSLWPNSPPFPAPFCGDGVCEVSRDEDDSTCAADCTAGCGDTVCQPDEGPGNCPGDCRIR